MPVDLVPVALVFVVLNGMLLTWVEKVVEVGGLSLSLRLSTHWITSAKLTMKSHRLRIPSKVPHRLRNVGKASREHGTSVRLDKLKPEENKTYMMHPQVMQESW